MPLDYERLMSMKFDPVTATYTRRDVMLYAIGIGVGMADATDPRDLRYVYERDLRVLPTFAVTLAAQPMLFAEPKFGLNYTLLLHGEQTLELHQPLPVEGTVFSEMQIDAIQDKGATKGAVMHVTRRLHDAGSGDLLVTLGSVIFLRGDGGFGGRSDGAPRRLPVPERSADFIVPVPTSASQALIYRLSGDYNPLHIDPQIAARAGFARPILHGLCGYGMVGRALIRELCDDDPDRLRHLDVRFTSAIYPGEPLHMEVWRLGMGAAAFRLIASERNQIVQDFGRFEYGLDS